MKSPGKNNPSRAEREKYWNEDYVRYWKARVAEANRGTKNTSSLVSGDVKTTPDTMYANAIGLLSINPADSVLELGCGFGRSLPALCQAAARVAAVDISQEMIRAAQESFKTENLTFHVSESENLPFPDASFDVVVCFAAFDAMYQAEALVEMNRVSKKGARILVTGKNDNYHDDDTAALEAELGARKKNHPNYFTDAAKLIDNLEKFGFVAETVKYYPRRGDFANGASVDERPGKFYEYLLVLNKISGAGVTEDFPISAAMSKTCLRQCKP